MLELNKIYCGDCLEVMKEIDDGGIDLTITSPPYDNLRNYDGFNFDFKNIAKELFRVTKEGGIVVWIVGDATINGNETGTSFKQALYFKGIGFNLHDTMIYKKNGASYPDKVRYYQVFEYMFVLSKGMPKTINLLQDRKNKWTESWGDRSTRDKSGELKKKGKLISGKEYGVRFNIWLYWTGAGYSTKDKIAFKHPAIFPEKLAEDHIISWSNENDIILDPMCGSGTTCKMAFKNNRKYIGIDISQSYVDIANKRLTNTYYQEELIK